MQVPHSGAGCYNVFVLQGSGRLLSKKAARHSFKIVQAVPMPMQYKFLPRAGMAGDGSVWRKTVFKLQETLHVYPFQPAERR